MISLTPGSGQDYTFLKRIMNLEKGYTFVFDFDGKIDLVNMTLQYEEDEREEERNATLVIRLNCDSLGCQVIQYFPLTHRAVS